MRYVISCTIKANDQVGPDRYRMRVNAPDITRAAKAGQFCMVEVADGLYPFLRRPMSFERFRGEDFSLLYKVEGEGSRLLSRMPKGQTISVQGPLGNGFPIDTSFDRHIIVAGGIGVATFPSLADALLSASGKPPEVLLAARTRSLLLCSEEFRQIGCTVQAVTDDGSGGEQGYAADLLRRLGPLPRTRVYVCGPMVMMRTTAQVAVEAGANCLVSLEAQMACGDGACLGCVVEANQEIEGEKRVRVCKDGPVFDSAVIDWEAQDLAYAL